MLDNSVKVGHPAKLSEADRQYLEALRDYGSRTQWKIANYIWQIHDAYNFQDHDVGVTWPRSEVADACGVLPKEVDSMVSTVERVGGIAETSDLDICYNAWKYIARHENSQVFLDELLDDMQNWGGKFPPVSVIRQKLADSKGNPPPPKPKEWTGKVYSLEGEGDIYLHITIEIDLNGPPPPPYGTPVTVTEARE